VRETEAKHTFIHKKGKGKTNADIIKENSGASALFWKTWIQV
jgi:hypothetical protein